MDEYIVRETGYPGTLKQEIVGELVRCRECELRYEGEYRGRRVMMCDYMDPGQPEDMMSDDDFCSRGRKNDAEKVDKQN